MAFFLASATALWLGIWTSVTPCPLATNIAAISFIGRRISHTGAMLWSGLFYTLGRSLTYVALGAIVVGGLLTIPGVSNFLQNYMNKLLGPILIVVGMFLLELIGANLAVSLGGRKLQKRAEKAGMLGAGLLGIVFTLSMCPLSAAIFFGTMVPLSIRHGSVFLLPLVYGVGTALPVIVFAVLLSLGGRAAGTAFNRLARIELWVRRIAGVVFILAGIYYCLTYIHGVPIMVW